MVYTSSSSSDNDAPPPSINSDPFIDQFLLTITPPPSIMERATFLLAAHYGESSRIRGYKRKEKNRERVAGAERLYKDYFADNPVYSEKNFRRRFRMRRSLFLGIVEALKTNVPYFVQRRDATGKLGLSSLQKVTAATRLLAYDVASDVVDEYLRIGASTALECLKIFCRGVHDIFSEQYLRQPTSQDGARLIAENAPRGFPGMLGSIDCMHWAWTNCPTAWVGQYQNGHQKKPSIILQAVASKDLWIWHAYFGVLGCNNDINVLERSNLFLNLAKGEAPPVRFEVNGNEYNMGYYLADGIYLSWAAFVKTIPQPISKKHRIFARYQEGVRKDVERAFGVLQARWHIVRGPSCMWDPIDLDYIMKTCIILHNMIVEDEREDMLEDRDFPSRDDEYVSSDVVPLRDPTVEFNAFLERRVGIRNRNLHHRLQEDLIEHIWSLHGDE